VSLQIASRKPISKSSWMIQTVLSFAYLVVSIIGAARHYPWLMVVGVTAISLAVGFAIFRRSWAFAMPIGWSIMIAMGAIVLGAISFSLTSRFAPNLMDCVPIAIGGLWLSTSLRGTWESQRVASASD
jgi:hypothetical protein